MEYSVPLEMYLSLKKYTILYKKKYFIKMSSIILMLLVK